MIDIHQTIKAEAESICPSCDHYPVCRAVDNHPCAECNQYAPVAQHGKWVSLGATLSLLLNHDDCYKLVAECIGTSNLRNGTVVQIEENEWGDSDA
jgi:hypothetical protein